jgi:hypothetical protein
MSEPHTVVAVEVHEAKDVSGTALGGPAQARAEQGSLTLLEGGSGDSHGGASKSEDGEELHCDWLVGIWWSVG